MNSPYTTKEKSQAFPAYLKPLLYVQCISSLALAVLISSIIRHESQISDQIALLFMNSLTSLLSEKDYHKFMFQYYLSVVPTSIQLQQTLIIMMLLGALLAIIGVFILWFLMWPRTPTPNRLEHDNQDK